MNDSNSVTADPKNWWQLVRRLCGVNKSVRPFIAWSAAWMTSYVAVSFVIAFVLRLEGLAAWVMALLPNAFGIATVRAYLRYLRESDELQRKMQLEGLAMGFGAAVVFCFGYQLLEQVGAPALPISAVLLPSVLAWAAGTFLVAYRYR